MRMSWRELAAEEWRTHSLNKLREAPWLADFGAGVLGG
jgi:hypothetical protein